MSSTMDFDEFLNKCGDFNRYQYLLLGLFGFISFFTSMHYFAQTIISFVPEHWCYHEKLVNKSFDEIRDIYSKFDSPSCTRLDDILNGTDVIVSSKTCDRWIYNYDYGYESINTELNWVCDSAYKGSLGQSMFFIGSAVGTLLLGILSDKYGRVPMLVAANLAAFVGDFSTIFVTDFSGFAVCRFISGMAADFNIYLLYIIVLEYISPSVRMVGLNLCIGIFYCAGLVITPWIAVLVGHWKYYLLTTSTPFLIIIAYYFIIAESAQWLVTQNNIDGAVKRLKRVAKINGKEILDTDLDKFRNFCEKQKENDEIKEQKRHSILDLFKTPVLRKRTILLFYLAMITTLCYNSVSRNVEGTGLSPFIMFSISSLTVLPSGFTLGYLQKKFGRKGVNVGSCLFCGIITIIMGIFTSFEKSFSVETNTIILATLQIIARYGVAVSYESCCQFAADLIPTCVRGQGVAATHVAGAAMSFLSAPVLLLSMYYKALPLFVLGIFFFTACFGNLFLPETLNHVLPKTINDGEMFGKDAKLLDFAFTKRKNSLVSKNKDMDINRF